MRNYNKLETREGIAAHTYDTLLRLYISYKKVPRKVLDTQCIISTLFEIKQSMSTVTVCERISTFIKLTSHVGPQYTERVSHKLSNFKGF